MSAQENENRDTRDTAVGRALPLEFGQTDRVTRIEEGRVNHRLHNCKAAAVGHPAPYKAANIPLNTVAPDN